MAFFALVYMGDRIIADCLEQITLKSRTRFAAVYRGGVGKSVLVLGNSRGVNAIIAPTLQGILGVPVLNLSYNGLSMELAEVFLADYLDHNAKPCLIVLEITNLGDRSDLVNDLRLYRKVSKRLEKVLEKEARISALMGRISHLYNLNGEIFLRSLYYFEKSDQLWVNRYRIDPFFLRTILRSPAEKLQFLSDNTQALSRILNLMREKEIPGRLLVSPYLPGYAERIRNLKEWKQEVQQLAGPEFKIWDYSNAIEEVGGFADRVHMNEYGSQLFLGCLVRGGFFNGI